MGLHIRHRLIRLNFLLQRKALMPKPKTKPSKTASNVSMDSTPTQATAASNQIPVPEIKTQSEPPRTLTRTKPFTSVQQEQANPTPLVNKVGATPNPPPKKVFHSRKTNYLKYDRSQKILIELSRTGTHTAGFIADRAQIASNSTLFKYMRLAANQSGLMLLSREEREYIQNRFPQDMVEKLENRLRDQNIGFKDRYVEAEKEFETQSRTPFIGIRNRMEKEPVTTVAVTQSQVPATEPLAQTDEESKSTASQQKSRTKRVKQ
jgi:hypothetical protein